LGSRLRCGHATLAVEETPGVNDEAGRVDVANYDAVLFDFQTFDGVDVSLHFAGDADKAGVYFALDFALVVDDDHTLGLNLAFEMGIDSDEPGSDRHLSLDLDARLKPADPLTG
jgi:hypothetical protein